MKQQVMTKPGTIEFREIAVPEIRSDQVLVKIRRIGICGSDLHVYHGKHPLTDYPVTQGHEVSGVVEKVGEKVNTFSIGDKVVIRPQITCDTCLHCKIGDYNICDNLKVIGFQITGTASEYYAIKPALLLKLPDSINIDQAALLEPLAVACSALDKVRKLDQIIDRDILILGAGPIGNLTAQVAKALGAKSVMITDINDFRLHLAQTSGIDHVINSSNVDLESKIDEIYGKNKVDSIIECVGSQITVDQAINVARKGSRIVLVGVFGQKPEVDLSKVQDHELQLQGMLMYKHEHFQKAIELLISGKINIEQLITHHFPFEEYDKAYKLLDSKETDVMKILIDVDQ